VSNTVICYEVALLARVMWIDDASQSGAVLGLGVCSGNIIRSL